MSLNRTQLLEIANKLEGFRAFQASYMQEQTYGKRRAVIGDYIFSYKLSPARVEDRDQLRRYFDAKWGVRQREINKYDHIPSLLPEEGQATFAIKLREVALVLENDSTFYYAYARKSVAEMHSGDRRNIVALACRRLKLDTPHGEFYEQLRRYFDDIYKVPAFPGPNADTASYANAPTVEFWRDSVCYPEQPRVVKNDIQPTQPEPSESDMTAPLKITTRTFANDKDISTYSDAEVFDLIARQEAEIETLKKIKAQPKKLVAEIAARQAGIDALVAYLDSKEA